MLIRHFPGRPPSLPLQRPLCLPSVSLGKGPQRQPPAPPIRKPCPLSPGGLQRCSGDAFQRHPRRLARLPESSRRGAPHLPSILARGGGGTGTCRDTGGPLIQQLLAAPLPQPQPGSVPRHAGSAVTRGLWQGCCGSWCVACTAPGGWQLMLGAGLVQAPARCPKGAQEVGRKRVRPLRRDAGPASRPPRLHAVSREPRLGQSSSVPGHLAWSPATRTWGADTPKG